MILQTSPDLTPEINKNGCYFMSLLFLATQKTGKSFNPTEIENLKKQAIEIGYMREDCFVFNPDGILLLAGLSTKYTGIHEAPERNANSNELEVLYFRYKQYGHFVAGVNGHVAFDPMGISNAVKLGELKSKRIFKIL